MAQFRERFALDLTDALTRDAEFTTHFFERARMTVFKAKRSVMTLRSRLPALERFRELLLEHGEAGCIGRNATAASSSMKSPNCESSSSPIGVSRLTGSCEIF